MRKVFDLNPDKPSPRGILELVMEHIDQVDGIVVLVLQKNGGMNTLRSYMSTAEVALLRDVLTKNILDEITDADEDEEKT